MTAQTRVHTAAATEQYAFTQDDFQAIADFAHEHFGLSLQESKKPLVYSRLARRLRVLGLPDFQAYRSALGSPEGEGERLELLSALTTNVTHFFREAHHFDTLKETVLPPLIKTAQAGGRVRLWSAGCSTGQEPYSLALAVLDLCPEAPNLDIKILATDIDPVVVQKAGLGVYTREELAPVPAQMLARDVMFDANARDTGVISAAAKSLVRFGVLNLIRQLPFEGPFDVIFCRNVAIYFDKQTQSKVWQTFSSVQKPGGYLFLGHSERLSGPAHSAYKSVGITAYVKNEPQKLGTGTTKGKHHEP